MGIKENLKAVKEELSTEEQFLESMIKGERFFKRNKRYIIAAISLAIIGFIGYGIQEVMEEKRLKQANEAYASVLKDPMNAEARSLLRQKNEKLFKMVELKMALEKNDASALQALANDKTHFIVSEVATYHLGQLNPSAISSEKNTLFSAIFLLQEGYDLLKKNSINEAKMKFAEIEMNSPLKQIAQNLEHYQGLKK